MKMGFSILCAIWKEYRLSEKYIKGEVETNLEDMGWNDI